jgi:hypothetical protein
MVSRVPYNFLAAAFAALGNIRVSALTEKLSRRYTGISGKAHLHQ